MRFSYHLTLFLMACAWTTLQCGQADAQPLTLLSQSRSVSADATICLDAPVDSSFASSATAGIFNQSVNEVMTAAESIAGGGLCIPGTFEEMGASAAQNTLIFPTLISGTGSASAWKAFGAMEDGSSNGNASFSATFQVTAPTTYQLSGQVAGEEVVGVGSYLPGFANVSLLQGSSVIHSVSPNAPDPTFGGGSENPFSFAGTLSPGTYTLTANAVGMATGPVESNDSSSFSFMFVPEPSSGFAMSIALAFMIRRLRR